LAVLNLSVGTDHYSCKRRDRVDDFICCQDDNYIANTRTHRASHEHFSENMKEEADHARSTLSKTMAARIEIKELGDPARQKEITDAIVALDGVIEAKIEKGALHVSYDPLATTEKKIEQAVRSTGNIVKAAATDTETAHLDLPTSANVEQAPVENAHDSEHS
jgi:copper chaperone CopZ